MPFSVFQLKQRDVSDTEVLHTDNKYWEHRASAAELGEGGGSNEGSTRWQLNTSARSMLTVRQKAGAGSGEVLTKGLPI